MTKQHEKSTGFTLAELLIALTILGVIATFTIPKILDSGSSSKHNAIVKEAAATLSGAYQNYKLQNSASASTHSGDLTPFINYVRVVTNTVIDSFNGGGSISCTAAIPCLNLHSGALIRHNPSDPFGDTTTTSSLVFVIDPDGVYSGSTSGPSKSIFLFLYINGRLSTLETILPNTYNDTASYNPLANSDPEYFSWGS